MRGYKKCYTLNMSCRFDSPHPRPHGSLMFITVGVLLKRLELGLRGISHIIVGEIHERDISTDFMIARYDYFLEDIVQMIRFLPSVDKLKRKKAKIVVMKE
uniref:Uncharacterized protein n=1 Tax=Wuchereria bancrofti TaxID=6293 RepID=A0A1I8EU07_WUCBA